MSIFKDSLKTIILSTIILLIVGVAYAWTEPTVSPPISDPSVSKPITTSITDQFKVGGLVIDSLGIANPASNALTVTGGITFSDGSIQTSAASSGGVPSGAIMFFNLSSCPSGWSEETNVRGRYIVGLPSGGTLSGSNGQALSNLEDRPVGNHTHTASDTGHSHSIWAQDSGSYCGGRTAILTTSGGNCGNNNYNSNNSTANISISSAGSVAGTNAPYIQYLTCQKN